MLPSPGDPPFFIPPLPPITHEPERSCDYGGGGGGAGGGGRGGEKERDCRGERENASVG